MSENDRVDINDENAQSLYSNLISFNINPEEVCMGLGIRDVKEKNLVHIHSYLFLTIPHFLRFADAVNKQIELLIEKGVISRETEQ
jgi:hypothetical protein